jgi:hypothetical protein
MLRAPFEGKGSGVRRLAAITADFCFFVYLVSMDC